MFFLLKDYFTKRQACIDNGYNFLFIINKKYDEFDKLIN